MTNEEANNLVRKESKRLWKIRSFKIFILIILFIALLKIFLVVRFEHSNFICQINVYSISNTLWSYMNDYDGRIPSFDAWNDTIMEYVEMDEDELPESFFDCPNSKSVNKVSDYSLNSNLIERAGEMSAETVFIFESEPGWNQSGGSEIFNSFNHENGGWLTTLSRPEGYFITSKDVVKLEWSPKGPKAQK